MGNVLLRGIIDHRHRIKIMKADGSVMKVRSPVCVKEILIDYPNYGIFEAPAGLPLGMGTFTRPLPERAELLGGHVYYLIPLPHAQDEIIDFKNNIFITRASSDHSIPDIGRDSMKQEAVDDVVNKINRGGVRIISSSYSTDGSTLRMKLRLRKEDLAAFLAALIQGANRESSWKPRLDTIVERHSPDGDL